MSGAACEYKERRAPLLVTAHTLKNAFSARQAQLAIGTQWCPKHNDRVHGPLRVVGLKRAAGEPDCVAKKRVREVLHGAGTLRVYVPVSIPQPQVAEMSR